MQTKQNLDLAINNGQVYLKDQAQLVPAHIGIRQGKIIEISATALSADKILDAKGLSVLPGVIDSQVHFREPGLTHKEDLESGTRAAAFGGVTSIFEMPNTIPSTTNEENFKAKMQLAQGRAHVNYAFYVGGSPENIDSLAELEKLPGCSGIKVFLGSSTGSLLVDKKSDLERILKVSQRRTVYHCEDEDLLRQRKSIALEGRNIELHPDWRNVETAYKATSVLLELATQFNKKVHVLHVTSAEEVELLKKHRNLATFEITPQHLTLSAPECYRELGSLAQMNPPIRDSRHREALWLAVSEGWADVIGSDHAPHTLEEKAKAYPESPSGMPGVQTLLPLMLHYLSLNKLSLKRLVELTSSNASRVFGCKNKGAIEIGYDADFTVVDLNKKLEVTKSWLQSRCGWSPFEGMILTGSPIVTIVGGQIVMQDGTLVNPHQGAPVSF